MTKPVITYIVCIDWDAQDFAADPDFSQLYDQISGDIDADSINFFSLTQGEQREEGNAMAATCEIRLRPGLCAKYSPFTSDPDLQGKVRPWLPVIVVAYHNEEYTIVFTGFISRIHYDPHPDVQSVIFYCTDGMDLLARQLIAQDPTDTELCSDGDAIDKILDAAGWPASRRDIDKDGGDEFVSYPACYEY